MSDAPNELPHECEDCGDDGSLYLSPRCHVGMPTFCVLTGDILTLECAVCGAIVSRLVVAPVPANVSTLMNGIERENPSV